MVNSLLMRRNTFFPAFLINFNQNKADDHETFQNLEKLLVVLEKKERFKFAIRSWTYVVILRNNDFGLNRFFPRLACDNNKRFLLDFTPFSIYLTTIVSV